MAIDVHIGDGTGKNGNAAVVNPYKDIPNGLVTYTHPYATDSSAGGFYFNPTFGINMNVDAGFTGTPDGVHDGTDSVLWTGTNLSGTKFIFNSVTQAQAGTKSVDGTASQNADEAIFTRASTINTGGYIAFVGYIYITDWSIAGTKEVELRLRVAGVDLGDTVDLSGFINKGLFNSWQKFIIPITSFGVGATAFDEVVVKTVAQGSGQPPSYFLDTLSFEEASGSVTYSIPVPKGFEFFLEDLVLTAAGPLDSRLASGTNPNIPYDKFVGLTLTTGIILQLASNDGIFNAGVFTSHIDLMATPGMTFQSGGDGTNTWVSYSTRFLTPPSGLGDNNASFNIVVNDDLSTLLYFRATARGNLRAIPKPNIK